MGWTTVELVAPTVSAFPHHPRISPLLRTQTISICSIAQIRSRERVSARLTAHTAVVPTGAWAWQLTRLFILLQATSST